ncbi:family 16 glycosylhydrolase [Kitasatospora terrestris]|uniref:GH16 domain-containing protein n=1 Tax=Kitasatospora terrestris TaxID=258051 RepID=A0ABP9EER1_9ACTN
MDRLLRRGWLALSGWAALACTALPGPDLLRLAVTAAFLVVCPGLALVRLVHPFTLRRGLPLDTLERAVLSVALSLALTALVAEAFYLARAFTVARATAALAVLTTLLVLVAAVLDRERMRRPGPRPAEPPGEKAAPDGRLRRVAGLGSAGLLALTTACGGSSAMPIGLSAPRSTASVDLSVPTAPGPWKKVFEDDFLGSRLDRADWATCYDWNDDGCTNAGNHELEWYLPSQVKVADGEAQLVAERRRTVGSDGKVYPWTSGMITTGRDSWDAPPRHTFTYGYFAAALRVPDEDTMFPAFWLLPEARKVPPELDVAEFISDARSVQMTVHWAEPDGSDTHQADRYGPVDFPAGFHVFAVDWEPTSLTWYVDGVERFRVTEPQKIPNVPMEILINLAVGYPVPPPADVDTATFKVDWVRVWQRPS